MFRNSAANMPFWENILQEEIIILLYLIAMISYRAIVERKCIYKHSRKIKPNVEIFEMQKKA